MKTILLAVIGFSPQVITETLYALHQSNRHVDAIHIITTRDGKEKIYTGLFGGKKGHYYKYLKEYGIPPGSINFSHENVYVVTDEYGVEATDIANEAHNEQLFKKCMDLAFSFTKDPETAVLFSIRKKLSDVFLKEAKDPATLMLSLVKEEKPGLTVNLKICKIIYKTIESRILCLPAWRCMPFLLCRKRTAQNRLNPEEIAVNVSLMFKRFLKNREITEIYKNVSKGRPLNEMKDGGITGLDHENFGTYKSRIKENLRDSYGTYALENLEFASVGSWPNTRCGIKMDKNAIDLVW